MVAWEILVMIDLLNRLRRFIAGIIEARRLVLENLVETY